MVAAGKQVLRVSPLGACLDVLPPGMGTRGPHALALPVRPRKVTPGPPPPPPPRQPMYTRRGAPPTKGEPPSGVLAKRDSFTEKAR